MARVVLRGLMKKFGEVTVVQDIDLEIRDGEFVSFLGPSGCGKTTTLRMIAGFETPTRGEITIGDRLVSSAERGITVPTEERSVGMVFQNYAVWPHMNVFQNVAYPLKLKRRKPAETRERVRQTLSLVRMGDLERRYPHELSGGQQQRVALARALVMEPQVMLLDEPLSNLDAKLREEMRFEIKEIQARVGITIVYVTHDQAEAMAMSDRIVLLHCAAIQQVGTPRELYLSPENEFVAGFIGLINFIPARVVGAAPAPAAPGPPGGGRWAGVVFAGLPAMSPLPVRLPPGAARDCLLAVRPESIRLLSPEQSDLRGTVLRKVYLGNLIDYRVEAGGALLRVETSQAEEFETGCEVGLRVERCVAFRAGEAPPAVASGG